MKKKNSTYNKCLSLLDEIKNSHPSISLGKHLETIREQCGDLWGVSDRTLLQCIQQYQSTISLFPVNYKEDIDDLLKEAEHMFDVVETEDEE
jgi:hypothetical protein